jgi:hypothetical protein
MDGQNGIPERGSFKKGQLHVGGEVAAVTFPGIERRPLQRAPLRPPAESG